MMTEQPHIVIIGGGFGGLYAAQHLKYSDAKVTLIDRRNFHLFQPLLYQVATGGLSPANIAAPLRAILKHQKNTEVLLAEVSEIDPLNRRVHFSDGNGVNYDYLVVATGATHNYFGNPQWEQFAPGLKTVEDATEIRRKVLMAFEAAERESDPAKRADWLRFVVVGAGPTGVELAGALGEIAHQTLKHNFRHVNPEKAEILLVEAGPRVLSPYAPELSEQAKRDLEELGVTVHTGVMVTDIQEDHVVLKFPDTGERKIATHTVVWGAGVQASPLGKILAKGTGAELDRAGRIKVNPDLSVSEHIYVLGDLAHCLDKEGNPLPGVAPVAMQQGKYLANVLKSRLAEPHKKPEPFRYFDKGSMATIGRSKAVAQVGNLKFSGFLAWIMWLFIHVLFLVEFENRVQVVLQWAWNYLTRNRSARLITGDAAERLPLRKEESTHA